MVLGLWFFMWNGNEKVKSGALTQERDRETERCTETETHTETERHTQ